MDELGTDRVSEPQKMLAAGYAVSRTNGMGRFVAHASRGSGICVILGVVFTGVGAFGARSSVPHHDPDFGSPEWVRWLFPWGCSSSWPGCHSPLR
jgi:hypothetical protein